MVLHAVITGGTRGIGFAIAAAFARLGTNVTLLARDGARAEKAVEALNSLTNESSPNVRHGVCLLDSVACEKSVRRACKELETLGAVHYLVNSAGVCHDALLLRSSAEHVTEMINVNLLGTMHVSREISRRMLRQGNGSIVNISSVVGINGNVGQSAYAASKAGVIGFSKSLAKELAPRGVRVNVVAPGFIETDMTAGIDEATRERIKAQILLGRFGEPNDVAEAVVYLSQAKYVTGQVLVVDGGMF